MTHTYARESIHNAVMAELMTWVDFIGCGGDPLTERFVEDLGLDSIDLFYIIEGIADNLDVDLPENDESGVRTVGDLVDLFCKHAGGE
jgi:acyl carrier protein